MFTRFYAAGNILLNLALGPRGRNCRRVQLTLLALGLYCLFLALQYVEVRMGLMSEHALIWLGSYQLLGALGFYALIRSGYNERLLPHDPPFMLWQGVHGVLAVIGLYASSGAARCVGLAFLVLVLAWGMFGLSAARSRGLTLFAFLSLGAVMLYKNQTDALNYPASIELLHLAVATLVMLGVSALSIHMNALRRFMGQQKNGARSHTGAGQFARDSR